MADSRGAAVMPTTGDLPQGTANLDQAVALDAFGTVYQQLLGPLADAFPLFG